MSAQGFKYSVITFLLFAAGLIAYAQSTHKVASGETLDKISKKYNVPVDALVAFNDIANPNLIVPGDVLKIPPPPGSPVEYKVQSGDTLGEIAAAYGTTVSAIIKTNNLSNPNSLKVGQKLIVPAEKIPGLSAEHPLPLSLKRQLDAIPVRAGRWKYIVIHHSATKSGTIKALDNYHRKKRRMENGLAYHFVIGNGKGIPDGKIEIGNRWKRQIRGGHLASEAQNQVAIGICLIGNFESGYPSKEQMDSLYALVEYLRKRAGVPKDKILPHTRINRKPTACPGRHFPTKTFLRNI